MKKLIITNEELKGFTKFMEAIYGNGGEPDLEGRLVGEDMVASEFAKLDSNFASAVEQMHDPEDTVEGYVYFDEGANRYFHVEKEDAEIVEIN